MSGSRYEPHPAVSAMEIDHELTLYHPETQAAVMLNETASAVWRLLDGRRTVEELTDELADHYQADADTVAHGVRAALALLEEHGLVEVSS